MGHMKSVVHVWSTYKKLQTCPQSYEMLTAIEVTMSMPP